MNRMHNNRPQRSKAVALRSANSFVPRSGFTLVEMLVSVALVVIMMAMFASVFQLAAGSVGTQRGIAENDQRARSVTIVMENDLKARSPQVVLPFSAGETEPDPDDADYSIRQFDLRRGYFYVSENDIKNDTDDVLQFTVELSGNSRDYYGRAALLEGLARPQFLSSNQPSRDDGDPNPIDNASNSFAAEISYFLRGSRLYRRVLLIRDPLEDDDSAQPTDANNVNYFDPDNPPPMGTTPLYTGNFWGEFDFSAYSTLDFSMSATNPTNGGATFHSIADLDNAVGTVGHLANPFYRFGHNHVTGQPREYAGSAGNQFLGRFTHEETSHGNFLYPQEKSAAAVGSPGNPMDPTLVLNDANGNEVIDQFERGVRRAEDLLLSNVHAFDVKVLDEKLARFVDVGHDQFIDVGGDGSYDAGVDTLGDYHATRRRNTTYGSNNGRIFDTWHPSAVVQGDADTPFRPMHVYPTSLGGTTQTWAASTNYNVNDVVFPNTPPASPADRYAYRVVTAGMSGPGPNDPAWPTGSGDTVTDGTVVWRLVENTQPLRAIQITIRYLDISSNQLRQVSLQVALTPTGE